MTNYLFVGPGAPQTNVRIKAGSFKKACEKFLRKYPDAENFRKSGSWHKEVAVFYHLKQKRHP